jgi:hypothetical protein
MTIRTRRIVVCGGAAAVFVVLAAPALHIPILDHAAVYFWLGGLWLWGLADRLIPPGAPGQNLNTSARDAFLSLSVFGLGLATALSLIYCLWNRRTTKKAVVVSYFVFLITLTSMSTANFAMGDALLNRKAQALIDLVLLTLGLIVVIELLQIRPSSTPGLVLRTVIVFLIILQGIALPGIYGLLWLLNWQNAITVGQSKNFNPGWISAAAGVSSAVIAILNYRASQHTARDAADKKPAKFII